MGKLLSAVMSGAVTRKVLLSCVCASAVVSTATNAQDESGFTLTPMIGGMFFDSEKNLDDSVTGSVAAGYRFDSPWAVELAYLRSNPDFDAGNGDADLDQYRLDGLYHLEAKDKLQPFVLAGLGENEFESGNSRGHDTFANVGAGIKYAVSSLLSLRSDIRIIQGLDSGDTDFGANLGAQFTFGGESKPKSKTKKAESKPSVKDSDNDGVADQFDNCPTTPANTKVDSSGCVVVMDSDKDGIVDSQDNCPNSAAGAKVDDKGCYVVLKEKVSVALNVNFANNSDEVLSDSVAEVKQVADFMAQYPLTTVEIEGHTDSSGSAAYNLQLSQKRADAVAKILVETFNVSSDRVKAMGYGESQPLVANDSRANMAKNRRVTAVVSGTAERVVK